MKKIILTSLILVLALITIFIYTVFTSNTEKTVVQQTIRRTNSDDTTKVTTSGPNFEKSTGGSMSSFFGPNKEEENEVKRNPLNFLLYANKDNESNKLDTGTNSETIFSFRSSSDQDSQTSEPQAQTSQTYSNQNQYQPGDEFIYSEDYDQQNFLSGLDDIYNNSSEWVDEYNEFDDVDYGFIEYDTPTTTGVATAPTSGSSTGGSSYSTYNEDDIVDDGRFLTKHTPYPTYHEDDAFCGIGYNTDRAIYVPYLVEGYWPLTEPSLLCDVGNYSDFSTIGDSTTKHIVENELGGKEVKISSRIYRGMIASWKCSGVNEGVEKKCIWLYYPSLPPVQSNNCGTAPNPKTASASELCKNGSFMFGITDDNKLLGSDPSNIRYSSTVGVRTYPTKSPSDPQIYYWDCFTDNISIRDNCSQVVWP